jgi:hypothetical protein
MHSLREGSREVVAFDRQRADLAIPPLLATNTTACRIRRNLNDCGSEGRTHLVRPTGRNPTEPALSGAYRVSARALYATIRIDPIIVPGYSSNRRGGNALRMRLPSPCPALDQSPSNHVHGWTFDAK